MISAEKSFYWILPPRATASRQEVKSASSGAAAANTAVFTGISTPPEGNCMVTFEAYAADIYLRFKPTNAAAGTTTANGLVLKAGDKMDFYLTPSIDVYVDHICPATGGTLKWYVSSPVYEHARIAGT